MYPVAELASPHYQEPTNSIHVSASYLQQQYPTVEDVDVL